MNYKAVITGDIVHSRKVENLQLLLQVLKKAVPEISKQLKTRMQLEIYRGDSFQLLIDNVEEAVKIAILIRARLRSKTPYSKPEDANIPIDKLWDARLSLGIGSIDKPAPKIVESTGEAFELSGSQLDEIKGSQDRIRIISPWKKLNQQFDVIIKLIDAIINRWTLSSSQAAYRLLLFKETQKEIAEALKISQPAVHKRLNIANIEVIESAINFLSTTIKNQTHGI